LFSERKTNRLSISLSIRRTNVPASLSWSLYKAINRHRRAKNAFHCRLEGGALAIWHNRLNSFLAHLPQAATDRIPPLREPFGCPDHVRQAGLPKSGPFLVKPVIVTDQNTVPGVNQLVERFFRAIGVDHEKCDKMIAHYPQPVKIAAVFP